MSLEKSLVLGRYRVLWQLDQKRLITTYIARDEHRDGLGTPVLIKQFLHDLGDKQGAPVTALFEELTGLTHFRHSGVVSLLDYGTVDNCLVTAYAHLPGMDLTQLCESFGKRQQPFPPAVAVYIARRLLDTLHYCHTRSGGSFVHGRITLGCIHLPSSGEPQIADFGLANLEDVAAESEAQLGVFQTRMSYSAPELTRGGVPTPQGDAYSVALLLYRLLSGSNPFRGRSIPETLQRVLQLAPAELFMPGWAHCAEANAVLMRALSKDPADRFQSCEALSAALVAIQIDSDASIAVELSQTVRAQSSDDWAQISRLARPSRNSQSSLASRDSGRLPTGIPAESKAPAFVSGLLTEQPRSVTEHTQRHHLEARLKRERRRQLVMLPTVLLPAAAIIFGLFLGRLGGAGVNASASRAVSSPSAAPPELVNGPVAELRTKLRLCVREAEPKLAPGSRVELDFGAPGALSGVRLNPAELVHTRLGACLLDTAWDANLSAPGAMSLIISLAADR